MICCAPTTYPTTSKATARWGWLRRSRTIRRSHRGGLPRPTLLQASTSSDAARKLFEAWAISTDARLQLFERPIECRSEIPIAWWDLLPDHWDIALEPERLDLMAAEFRAAIAEIEAITGRKFDQ